MIFGRTFPLVSMPFSGIFIPVSFVYCFSQAFALSLFFVFSPQSEIGGKLFWNWHPERWPHASQALWSPKWNSIYKAFSLLNHAYHRAIISMYREQMADKCGNVLYLDIWVILKPISFRLWLWFFVWGTSAFSLRSLAAIAHCLITSRL